MLPPLIVGLIPVTVIMIGSAAAAITATATKEMEIDSLA